MDIQKQILDTEIYLVFTLILIISINFLKELFPCRIQYELENNMILKHIFGFLAMIFFVVLSSKEDNNNNIIFSSLLLYLFFILITKSNLYFFYIIILLLGIAYIINILKKKREKDNEYIDKNKMYDNITFILYILIIIATILGVLVHMGEKKLEYKKKFDYIKFFIGHTKCIHKYPNVEIIKSIRHSFVL